VDSIVTRTAKSSSVFLDGTDLTLRRRERVPQPRRIPSRRDAGAGLERVGRCRGSRLGLAVEAVENDSSILVPARAVRGSGLV
jgi:hypothetical protein